MYKNFIAELHTTSQTCLLWKDSKNTGDANNLSMMRRADKVAFSFHKTICVSNYVHWMLERQQVRFRQATTPSMISKYVCMPHTLFTSLDYSWTLLTVYLPIIIIQILKHHQNYGVSILQVHLCVLLFHLLINYLYV